MTNQSDILHTAECNEGELTIFQLSLDGLLQILQSHLFDACSIGLDPSERAANERQALACSRR